ncbi:MAG: PhoH family protein [Desulfatiglans sp.]|nr:PhoH family protein [Desulfatiglans sp.]
MTPKKEKTFVLDTNVILHDSSCIYHFQENDIVIPITVLEELDQFKKGNSSLNYHAREFLRNLDSISGDLMFESGIEIGAGHGKIMIKLEREFHPDLKLNFSTQKADHHVLNICYHLCKDNPEKQVILVSKDVNLRMKAKAVNLTAQDYTSDHVKDASALYEGLRVEENISAEAIDILYQQPYELDLSAINLSTALLPNQFLILKNGRKSALGVYDSSTNKIRRVDKRTVYGITPRNAEQIFAFDALLNRDIKLVTISGKAGTGKTLLALAAGLETHRYYRQMFLARPVVPLSNKDIGYLPGDIKSKLDPYMQPLYDNLGVIQNQFDQTDADHKRIKEYLESEKLVISPLSYIRGRSLVKIFFIVDEAQNLTPHEVKTIITRAGEGTKIVFTGDIFQIDHPYLDMHSNGLSYLIGKMQGQKIYSHITLQKGERSELAELASDLL